MTLLKKALDRRAHGPENTDAPPPSIPVCQAPRRSRLALLTAGLVLVCLCGMVLHLYRENAALHEAALQSSPAQPRQQQEKAPAAQVARPERVILPARKELPSIVARYDGAIKPKQKNEKPAQKTPVVAAHAPAALQQPVVPNPPPGKPAAQQHGIPMDPEIEKLNAAGCDLMGTGDTAGARACFEKILQRLPLHQKALNNLALCCYLDGSEQEALKHLNKALAADPGHTDTYANLGIVYQKSGMDYEAETMFKKALLQNPVHPETLYNYGLLLEKVKRNLLARIYFERFIQVSPAHLQSKVASVKEHLVKVYGAEAASRR